MPRPLELREDGIFGRDHGHVSSEWQVEPPSPLEFLDAERPGLSHDQIHFGGPRGFDDVELPPLPDGLARGLGIDVEPARVELFSQLLTDSRATPPMRA